MALKDNLRPVVGIPCRYNWNNNYYELRETYSDAIYAAGGIPVLVPLIPESAYIESLVEHLDAVCLSGAPNDIDPLRYGQEPSQALGPVVARRDETDMLLLAAAEAAALPVLAICFGIQSLNVYRGGTLIQDIPTEVKGALKHMQEGTFRQRSHSINLSEGSLLAELAGSARVLVNSYHHQAIDVVGRDLKPIAWAADGIIEAVINTRPGQFILGVQWHPEVGWEEDSFSQAIFKHFISVARELKQARQFAETGA
jgi:putative glutamine amidotransferase